MPMRVQISIDGVSTRMRERAMRVKKYKSLELLIEMQENEALKRREKSDSH